MAQKFTVPVTIKNLSTAGSDGLTVFLDQESFARLKVEAGGRITWGAGSGAGDTNLYRDSANVLKTDDTFKAAGLYVSGTQIDPTGATAGDALVFNGTKFVSASVAGGGGGGGDATLTVSDTPPAGAGEGELWFNSTDLEIYIYYSNAWVQLTDSQSGVQELYELVDVLINDPVNGETLVYNGTEWENGFVPRLQTARTISLTGDVSGSVSFDGSQNVSMVATVQPSDWNQTNTSAADYIENKPDVYNTGDDLYLDPQGTGLVYLAGDMIPLSSSVSLGSSASPYNEVWVGPSSLKILSQDGGPTITLSNQEDFLRVQSGGLIVESTASVSTGGIFRVDPQGQIFVTSAYQNPNKSSVLTIIGNNVGTFSPPVNSGGMVHITGHDNLTSRIVNDSYGNSVFSQMAGRHAAGTSASPTAARTGPLFRITGAGWRPGADFGIAGDEPPVFVDFYAKEDFEENDTPTEIRFYTTPSGQYEGVLSTVIDSSGIQLEQSGSGITFYDNTVQTTAWTGSIPINNLSDVTITASYSIGDTGPAGGKIFITPSTAGNTTGKYFEVSPSSATVERRWSTGANHLIAVPGGTAVEIGTGEQNTINIVAQSGNVSATSAAVYASEYTYGGYSDWFLPSKDELNQLVVNKESIDGYSSVAAHWSSSESWAEGAWVHDIGANALYDAPKDYIDAHVRPVRSFTAPAIPNSGDFLKYDGTAWVNEQVNYVDDVVAGNGISVTHTPGEGSSASVALNATLNNLSDVTIGYPLTYSIGDTGPAGGKIFITPSTAGNTTGRYFEAAPSANPDVSRTWATNVNSNQMTAVSGADGTTIGTGAQNTIDIVAQSGNIAASSAAAYCADYTYGGFSDWFLPSRDELNQLYIQRTVVGGLNTSTNYWSSSEYDGVEAWRRFFGADVHGISTKDNFLAVRPVRSFDPTGSIQSGDFLKYDGSEWVNEPINLGTDTVGNYMSDLTQGTGVTITHTPGEGSNATIAIGQAVGTSSSVQFAAVTAPLIGNASTASALATARKISLSGDLSGSASFNGTSDITISASVVNSGVSLDEISDVVITSPLNHQSLTYNGTNWVNEYAPTVTYARNAEANALSVGEVVYLFGAAGDRASVKRASNTSDTTSSKTIGVVAVGGAAGADVSITTVGYVSGLSLGGYTSGDTLWLGSTAGTMTTTKPTGPSHSVFIGVVTRANNGNGIMYVKCQNGYELDELHNVAISASVASGDFLKYDGTVWVNDPINLGTDTVGNYMSGVSAGTGIAVSHTPGEGSTATISIESTAWTSYTPTITADAGGFALNNGTLTGRYKQVGKTVFFKLKFVFGSTTAAGTGHWNFSLPVTAYDSDFTFSAAILDSGIAWYGGIGNGNYTGSTSSFAVIIPGTSAATTTWATVGNGGPFSWGTADNITITGSYEAA